MRDSMWTQCLEVDTRYWERSQVRLWKSGGGGAGIFRVSSFDFFFSFLFFPLLLILLLLLLDFPLSWSSLSLSSKETFLVWDVEISENRGFFFQFFRASRRLWIFLN